MGGAGDFAHQTDIACAVDQPPTLGRNGGSKRAGDRDMGGVQAGSRATEDTDRTECTGHRQIYPKIVALMPDIGVP